MNQTNLNIGLTDEEASRRAQNGQSNGSLNVKTKSVAMIFRDNICTLFNLINITLFVLIAFVGSWRNTLFMGVVLCNIGIGIFQEIRSKRVIDRLSILSAPKAKVLRSGMEKTIPISDVVIGDVVILSNGMQVPADCEVAEGECEVDESLITGESDGIPKRCGDELLSGSFVTEGSIKAVAVRVGEQSQSGKITKNAKYVKKHNSEMMKSINKIIKAVSICIVPFGLVLFYKAFFVSGESREIAVTSSCAALLGMIPEGLVLLTSVALAISAIKLARRNTLCQDLYCAEELARVDVLCLDKTGTLTEGRMDISEIVQLDKQFDVKCALEAFAAAFPEGNPTVKALREQFTESTVSTLLNTIPFNSTRKWSAAEFSELGTLILGAPSFVLGEKYAQIAEQCEQYARKGLRVLVLARSEKKLPKDKLPEDISAAALILLSDKVRDSARETLKFFRQQDVTVKVISGDDPATVANVALRAGLENLKSIDMREVSEEKIPEICEKYAIFGRSNPEQKLLLIKALKLVGHKVAMIGDGINDVPSLREADCSVAVQSGSDAARAASQLVLMTSDFAAMPKVVEEGRRCINNIERSATLFLNKTIYSFILAAVFLFLPFSYPFKPIQMTLISAITIGIPSFLLTLEPNYNRVSGAFLFDVLKKSAPGGISVTVGICLLSGAEVIYGIPPEQVSVIAVLMTGAMCFRVLWNICRPFNVWRGIMFGGLIAVFCGIGVLFGKLFYITPLKPTQWLILGILTATMWLIQWVLEMIFKNKRFSLAKWNKM
ncbi:MAG: cation-translocating P-type ATPase [Oscillospiraceae bacterium]|nr:cation-translocating P-type ATPase [Oscillospiraceae bacterium]